LSAYFSIWFARLLSVGDRRDSGNPQRVAAEQLDEFGLYDPSRFGEFGQTKADV
jgi:hypothetical protein